MKNILVIQGGGRPKGNTARLIDSFREGAEEVGHLVEVRAAITEDRVEIMTEPGTDLWQRTYYALRQGEKV